MKMSGADVLAESLNVNIEPNLVNVYVTMNITSGKGLTSSQCSHHSW